MTDPLDDLKQLMDQATPAPDAARKADTLRQAEKNFADVQGSRNATRPTSDRPRWAGIVTGVGNMFASLTSRSGLTATTAIVAVGLVALVPVLQEGPPELDLTVTEEEPILIAPEPVIVEPTIVVAQDGIAVEVTGAAQGGIANTSRVLKREEFSDLMEAEIAAAPPMVEPLLMPDLVAPPPNTESFANEDTNPLKVTAEEPVSTFSIDVDTASYAVMRDSILGGTLPPKDAIRIEELINYFPYDYAAPESGPFQPTVTVTPTPWNAGTQLMHIAIQGALPEIQDRPPLNLVFLIDTSGSMNQDDKLPLLKQSFRLMLGQLSDQDQVSIVTYAGSAGRVLDPTPASERATILGALNRLSAGGSTAGQDGLEQAYATAAEMSQDGEVTRVILATDGDFNVGIHDPEALEDFIARKRDSGTYLSVLGFGRGNLDDATMQALAQNGNGTAAYIDTLSEAQKVLVDQLTGALFPIANDVKIQMEFNPATIAEYRLIGYETRALKREDFNNDKVDAGEIGAGHSVTALYEVTPVGSPARLTDALRYTASEAGTEGLEELAFLRLRYKQPGATSSQLIELPITAGMGSQTAETRFAAAIAGFGQLLTDPRYLGDWSFDQAITLAEGNTGDDTFGYRREAVQLMRLAQSLSE